MSLSSLFFSSRATVRGALLAMVALCVTGLFVPLTHAQMTGTPAPAAPTASTLPQGAVLPNNPYGAIVPVDDQSQASRDKGLRMALIHVLKGIVGRSDQSTSPILTLAPRLVQQYAFIPDAATSTVMLRAIFDRKAVEDALRAQGLPMFGVDSDVVEAWVVSVSGLRSVSDYSRVVRHFTRIRGVRRLDVDELCDDTVQLRMTVEGGVSLASVQAEKGGLIAPDGTGNYVLAGR